MPQSRCPLKGRLTLIALAAVLAATASPLAAQVTQQVTNVTTGRMYATIQAALDESNPGDELVVGPGRYFENIRFPGWDVVLRSTNPQDREVIAATIIDGSKPLDPDAASVVTFTGIESPACVLSGFTITGGTGTRDGTRVVGGGICGSAARSTITYCHIVDNLLRSFAFGDLGGGLHDCDGDIAYCRVERNQAQGQGAGFEGCDGLIRACTVAFNQARTGGGGLARCHGWIDDCHIVANTAGEPHNGGGGLFDCDGLITNCTISANGEYTVDGGGMILCDGMVQNCRFTQNLACDGAGANACRATFVECSFIENDAGEWGGGVAESDGATLLNCLFERNQGRNGGAAIALFRGLISNCTIRDNRAPFAFWGGALYNVGSRIVNCTITGTEGETTHGTLQRCRGQLINCTISGNKAKIAGVLDCDLEIVNCILWDNSPDAIQFSRLSITHSIVQGGWPGEGNIDADPLLDANYRPLPGSPAIDAGSNLAVPADALDLDGDGDTSEPTPLDLAGRARFQDDPATPDSGAGTPPIVDMGAFEFVPLGDVNCDGAVDLADVDAFVLALVGRASYQAAFPACEYLNADFDADGAATFDDIDAFVDRLTRP